MRINLARRTPVIANATGGLSGPAVLPIAVRMIDAVTRVVDIPVIGMGGVVTSADALELMIAGASAVGVGTANFTDPLACPKIINGLEPLMDDLGIASLEDLRTQVRQSRRSDHHSRSSYGYHPPDHRSRSSQRRGSS